MLRHSVLRLYTDDAAVIAAALPLLAWVALFHTADAAQCVAAFVLRAYRIATLPMLIFAVSLWGVGLGGGYVLAFDLSGHTPPRAARRTRLLGGLHRRAGAGRTGAERPAAAGAAPAVAARVGRRRYGPGVKLTPAAASAGTASIPRPAAGDNTPYSPLRPSVPSARPKAAHTTISGVER